MWPDRSFTFPASQPSLHFTVSSFSLSSQVEVKPDQSLGQLLAFVHMSRPFSLSYPTSSPNTASVPWHVIQAPPSFWALPEAGFPLLCQACDSDSWKHQVASGSRSLVKCSNNAWQRASGRAPSSSKHENWARTAAGHVSTSTKFIGATRQAAPPGWQTLPSLFIHLTQFPFVSEEKKENLFPIPKFIFPHKPPSNLAAVSCMVCPGKHSRLWNYSKFPKGSNS